MQVKACSGSSMLESNIKLKQNTQNCRTVGMIFLLNIIGSDDLLICELVTKTEQLGSENDVKFFVL